MTDQRKDEIWVEFDRQGEGYVNFEEVDNSVHYVRASLSQPVPDDVAEKDLMESIAYAREYIVDSRVNYLAPHHVEILIRYAQEKK